MEGTNRFWMMREKILIQLASGRIWIGEVLRLFAEINDMEKDLKYW